MWYGSMVVFKQIQRLDARRPAKFSHDDYYGSRRESPICTWALARVNAGTDLIGFEQNFSVRCRDLCPCPVALDEIFFFCVWQKPTR